VIEIQNGEVKPRTYIEKDLRDKMVIFHTLELHVSHSKSKIEIHLGEEDSFKALLSTPDWIPLAQLNEHPVSTCSVLACIKQVKYTT
jgi:hypothetical protein